jgi:CRISPR/Cas system-associated exonuclease Cas4 (RecB family)
LDAIILKIYMADFKKQYNPNRGGDWNFGGKNWKLSRSKIELYVECPRCFYLDNKLGTARPRGPAFTLNVAVDELFKREFDDYREKALPHPIMTAGGVEAVPFKHKSLNDWRENFTGITYKDRESGFTISGAVDDIWQKSDGKLIVIDYKATAKEDEVLSLSDSAWEESYKRQMGVYQWLLRKNGFEVDDVGYFVYANARIGETVAFNNTLTFETNLVPCVGETKWIDDIILEIKSVLAAETVPKSGEKCEFCPYREACGKKLQAIHYAQKAK